MASLSSTTNPNLPQTAENVVSPSRTSTLMFNGVEERDGFPNTLYLIQNDDCGANITQLFEMQRFEGQETIFSYDFSHFDESGSAVVKAVYTPTQLSASFCGVQLRKADDALKLLLRELSAMQRTEIALKAIGNGVNGEGCEINFPGGLSRLRIKPREILHTITATSFVINDIIWELEYDSLEADQTTVIPPSTTIKEYLNWLETKWIPLECLKKDSPFFALKQVVIAQHILKFMKDSNKQMDFTNIINSSIVPRMSADPCDDIIFLNEEKHFKVWDCLEKNVGCAVLINFFQGFQDVDIAILLQADFKTQKTTYHVMHGLRDIDVQGMHMFGVFSVTAPCCPQGGVVLKPFTFKTNWSTSSSDMSRFVF